MGTERGPELCSLGHSQALAEAVTLIASALFSCGRLVGRMLIPAYTPHSALVQAPAFPILSGVVMLAGEEIPGGMGVGS